MTEHGTNNYILSCPFCEFEDNDADFLNQHVAFCHPEDPVPQAPHPDWAYEEHLLQEETEESTSDLDNSTSALYVTCPHGCGETVVKTELQLHLDLHVAESVALDESGGLHVKSVEGEDHQGTTAPSGPSATYDDEDVDDVDKTHEYTNTQAGHSKDIVLQGKSTRGTTRRRHKKESNKSVINGVRRLGVCFSLQSQLSSACSLPLR